MKFSYSHPNEFYFYFFYMFIQNYLRKNSCAIFLWVCVEVRSLKISFKTHYKEYVNMISFSGFFIKLLCTFKLWYAYFCIFILMKYTKYTKIVHGILLHFVRDLYCGLILYILSPCIYICIYIYIYICIYIYIICIYLVHIILYIYNRYIN